MRTNIRHGCRLHYKHVWKAAAGSGPFCAASGPTTCVFAVDFQQPPPELSHPADSGPRPSVGRSLTQTPPWLGLSQVRTGSRVNKKQTTLHCFPHGTHRDVARPDTDVSPDCAAGPQAYEPQPVAPAAPAYTIQSRPQPQRAPDPLPGPADYTADPNATKPTPPAFTIAARAPTATDADCTPGPGEFCPSAAPSGGPAFTIPVSARDPGAPRGYAPGPGEYDHAAAAAADGPAFTIPRAVPPGCGAGDADAEHLGPGAYDPRGPTPGPSFTMGCIVGERIVPGQAAPGVGEMPGPQDYDPAALPRGPAFTLGLRRSGGVRVEEEGAGPGAYDIPGVAGGPAFTMPVCARLPCSYAPLR